MIGDEAFEDAHSLIASERPDRRQAVERMPFDGPGQDIPLAKALAMTSATAAISRSPFFQSATRARAVVSAGVGRSRPSVRCPYRGEQDNRLWLY